MAQRFILSLWIGLLTPSSIGLQVGCTLLDFLSANFPSSPCLPHIVYNLHSFNRLYLEGQLSHGLFPLPIFPKIQIHVYLQNLQNIFQRSNSDQASPQNHLVFFILLVSSLVLNKKSSHTLTKIWYFNMYPSKGHHTLAIKNPKIFLQHFLTKETPYYGFVCIPKNVRMSISFPSVKVTPFLTLTHLCFFFTRFTLTISTSETPAFHLSFSQPTKSSKRNHFPLNLCPSLHLLDSSTSFEDPSRFSSTISLYMRDFGSVLTSLIPS